MENWYDEEEDILGIRFQDGEYWKSIGISDNIVVDISKERGMIGMEIHNASDTFSGDIRKVIEAAK
jgi:uncharacterized protein YuzE|tara:strand:+ start:437 stop:634 length:198 start_codon:yes stop_codon:yes gene_type:complete